MIERRVAAACRRADIVGLGAVSPIEGRVQSDEIVEMALGLVVSPQQGLHTESQCGIHCALAVEQSHSRRVVLLFSGRQKHGLHAHGIGRHRIVLLMGQLPRGLSSH